MKLLLDMNLSPDWVEALRQSGWDTVHWSSVGDPCATDTAIMQWALKGGYVVFTHDLDFGTLLAVTRAQGPSVIQLRTQDVMPQSLGERMMQILRQYETALQKGALITIDEAKSRVRILPFL
jgi:predicted nuclease of predicted toxin-antitoxin system